MPPTLPHLPLLPLFLSLVILQVNAQLESPTGVNISVSGFEVNSSISFNSTVILQPGEVKDIFISNVRAPIAFFIVQTHSFLTNTSLSYQPDFRKTQTVTGVNIGLVQEVTTPTYLYYLKNNHNHNATILIAVTPYEDNVPIPGGCNMEFDVEIAPYQRLRYSDEMVVVDAQAASFDDYVCHTYLVDYKMYHIFLPERDFTPDTYFDMLRKMLTVDDIIRYGIEGHKHIPNENMRSIYSAYRGTGAVYAIVATYGNRSAAYVPITTYACDARNWVGSCDGPNDHFSWFIFALMLFVGFFMCFNGHRFFKTSLFIVGTLTGSYLSYIGMYYTNLLGERDLLIVAVSIGAIVGFLWVVIWWFYGIPILSILLTVLLFGFFYASLIFYSGLGDVNIFESDLTYWGIFICIMLLPVIILIGFTYKTHIFACSVLGAVAFILPIDHYIGTNLRYMLVNVLRRATVQKFNYALLASPFEVKDLVLLITWFVMTVSGMMCQMRQQRGRPPFPPPPSRSHHMRPLNERTPLLGHQQNVTSQPNNTAERAAAPNKTIIA